MMPMLLAAFQPVTDESNPFEYVLLGVGVLLTLALLVGFLFLLAHARRSKP